MVEAIWLLMPPGVLIWLAKQICESTLTKSLTKYCHMSNLNNAQPSAPTSTPSGVGELPAWVERLACGLPPCQLFPSMRRAGVGSFVGHMLQ